MNLFCKEIYWTTQNDVSILVILTEKGPILSLSREILNMIYS